MFTEEYRQVYHGDQVQWKLRGMEGHDADTERYAAYDGEQVKEQ